MRNTVQARGQEAIDFLLNDHLPRLGCPNDLAQQFVLAVTTQQSKDFRKTFGEFVKAMRA